MDSMTDWEWYELFLSREGKADYDDSWDRAKEWQLCVASNGAKYRKRKLNSLDDYDRE